jgi:arsenate reductase-like glutaredoxin family protein
MADVTILHNSSCSTSKHALAEDDDYVTAEEVADLLVEHPRLMQRPVLIKANRTIIGSPKDGVRPFLTR